MSPCPAEAALGPAPTGLTSWRWVLAGIGCGLLALVLARLVALLVVTVLGAGEDVQATYRDAAGGGIASLVFSLLFLAVLTPIGEELLFRGVVTTALLRYGGLVGVIGSALVFALAHGFNPAFFTAIVVGLVAAEVRRRSGSVWPGVLVHVVNNLLAQALALLAAGAFG